MKYSKIISLAILSIFVLTGIAFADAIPQVTDAKNLPIVWTQSVYNGSGADISTGIIVEWDYDTSDPAGTAFDDRTNYVQTCDSAGDIWTAGVTPWNKGIADGNRGTIIVRGPAIVQKEGSTTVTAGDIVESDANGQVSAHDGAAVDEGTLGVAIKNAAPADFPEAAVIWIHPLQYDKD